MSEKIKIEALELAKSHEINASYCRGENRLAEDSAKVLRSQHGEITRLTADRDALQARLDAMVPLTDEEVDDIWAACSDPNQDEIDIQEFARDIQAAIGIKALEGEQ